MRSSLGIEIKNVKAAEKMLEKAEEEKNKYYQSLSQAENYI